MFFTRPLHSFHATRKLENELRVAGLVMDITMRILSPANECHSFQHVSTFFFIPHTDIFLLEKGFPIAIFNAVACCTCSSFFVRTTPLFRFLPEI